MTLEQDADTRFDVVFHAYLDYVLKEGCWCARHAPDAFEVWRKGLLNGFDALTGDERLTLEAVQWPTELGAEVERIADAIKPFKASLSTERCEASFWRWAKLQKPA
jgi:hypothetical protein